jgi:hypothetical protein
MFGIMVERNYELDIYGSHRKYKYRGALQGNSVFDQDYESAISQDLGSSPALVEASKDIDCYGCLPGHNIEQADAEQAYRRKLGFVSLRRLGLIVGGRP